MKQKSQAFSMDIMIAIGIFIIGIIVFLVLMSGNSQKDVTNRLTTESEAVPQRLMAQDTSSMTNATFIVDSKVDETLLSQTLEKPYDDLKRQVGVTSDFCIHFEDEEGNIIDLDESPCRVRYSIGDTRLNLTISYSDGSEKTIPCGVTEIITPCS
jgi:hypothetical protein